MLRSRSFLTTTLGLLGALLGFGCALAILLSGILRNNSVVQDIMFVLEVIFGAHWNGVVFIACLFLTTTLGSMFVGFRLARSFSIPNKESSATVHPLD